MFEHYLSQTTFSSYDEFFANFRIDVPENFNFAFDVVDRLAQESPELPALIWCDEHGKEASFTFAEIKYYSDKVANYLRELGIGKGDPVMLILKRRYSYWFCLIALHKLGAIAIPATHLLKKKDLIYRNNAASVQAIIAVNDAVLLEEIDAAKAESPTLRHCIVAEGERDGWLALEAGMERASAEFVRPTGEAMARLEDIMLLYFTSGTTGLPKMVQHDFSYPLGHILTAQYWQNARAGGRHLTVADTGWAKAAWGKVYGQWLSRSAVFVYDYDRFKPTEMLDVIARHKVTTFCAPPTLYRFLIKEDLSAYDLSALEYCVVAGEPLNPEVYHAFYKATGLKLMEGFGQTEMTVCIATFPWMEPQARVDGATFARLLHRSAQ